MTVYSQLEPLLECGELDSRELVGVTVRDSHLRGPSEVIAGNFLLVVKKPRSSPSCSHYSRGQVLFVPIFHFRLLLPPHSALLGFPWVLSGTLVLTRCQVSLADTFTDLPVLVFLTPLMYIGNSIFIHVRGSMASRKHRVSQLPGVASTFMY